METTKLLVLLAVVICQTGSLSFDACAGCGWSKFGNHCYYFSKHTTTWYEASIHCRRLGGYLAKVNRKEENDWLKNYGRLNARKHKVKGGFWLGAEDIVEGKWQWQADNSALKFTDWNRGQPSNAGGREDCLHLHDGMNFRWNDAPCTHQAGYICERPMFLKDACMCYA